jgi:hypothetical protein
MNEGRWQFGLGMTPALLGLSANLRLFAQKSEDLPGTAPDTAAFRISLSIRSLRLFF